jgi:hypothetical protein
MGMNEVDQVGHISMSYLDSPSTTSATTYQVYFRQNNSLTYINPSSQMKSSITCFEIKG